MSADGKSKSPLLGALALGAGALLALAVMAADRAFAWSFYVAAGGLVVAAFGLLDLLGAFDAPAGEPGPVRELRELRWPLATAALALLGFLASVRFAAAGSLGIVAAAVVVPTALLLLVVTAHRLVAQLPEGFPETSSPPWEFLFLGRAARRHGFWVVVVATLLYLPLLGSFALVDPWESHYGEVAREMLARGDFLSPWWAQEKWFWSKPVLDLWLEALSMRAFGVHALADTVLAPVSGVVPRPEWALRLPVFCFAVLGLYFLYKGVAATFGRRAGLLAALVLATMPQFFLMAHQAVTDMPLVGSLAAAMGLLLLGFAAEPRARVRSCGVRAFGRVFHLSAAHLVLGAAVLLVLPQVLYLASRNLTLELGPFALCPHADAFWSGSAGNCQVPGNAPCERFSPLHARALPVLQAAFWLAALVVFLRENRAERRTGRVAFLGAFVFAALATMAKGPVGVALPAASTLATLLVTGRARLLLRLQLPTGVLLVVLATLPWYLAVFSRHGQAFTDELVFRHMVNRATSHIHDLNGTDDVSFRYYLWQLGYALFGWAGLAPIALFRWPGLAREGSVAGAGPRQVEARALAALWFVLAFALFTAMPTKFHHYIFPALPPAAMLVGLLLDELLGDGRKGTLRWPALGAAALGGAALVAAIARDLASKGVLGEARLLNLVTYNYQRAWPETLQVRGPLLGFGAVFVALLVALAVPRLARWAAGGLVVAALGFAVWGLDGYLLQVAPHWGQRELVEAYYQARGSEKDPLAAYNMNWKGENFYSGNHVAVFPAGGRLDTWVEGRRKEGARSVFVLTEHSRVPALQRELPGATTVELTDAGQNNKFVLVKATYD